jgi:hypothetical protein
MKATARLLVAALAAAGMAVSADALADRGSRGGGAHGVAKHGGGHYGGRHWGSYRGAYVGRSYWGGHRSHWYGPRLGFYFGAPVVLGLGYWGSPFYDYPRETVVYREVIREPESDAVVHEERRIEPAPRAEPAPTGGPLYMNYCESSREYYPKVARCPEGWKFVTPTS